MRSSRCNCQSVRYLRAFVRTAAFAFMVLALANCSANNDKDGNESQTGSAGLTDDAAGRQSNGAGGGQAISAVETKPAPAPAPERRVQNSRTGGLGLEEF